MTYEEIVSDANNLYKAYRASIKGSKWKETTQKFMMNFLRYIFSIQEELLNRTLQNGPTEEFSLSERGRVRPITNFVLKYIYGSIIGYMAMMAGFYLETSQNFTTILFMRSQSGNC